MAYEVFTETRLRTKEYISVTANKTFGFPRPFIEKQKINSKQKCVVMYDADEQKIALHFSDTAPKFGFSVRIPNDKQGGMVVARSFFEAKKIDVKKYAHRYDFEKVTMRSLGIDKDGVAYVIKLSSGVGNKPSVSDISF